MPPAAVRAAQFCLVARVLLVVAIVFSADLAHAPGSVVVPQLGHVILPDGATWSAMAPWIFAAAVFEIVLVTRLGRLQTGSRHGILLVESVVIVLSGLYTAAGLEAALLPLVLAIAAVVLLRLDHVRHSFNRARAERRILWQKIPAVLYEGYSPPEPTAAKEVQRIGYRVGVDGTRVEKGASEMSRT